MPTFDFFFTNNDNYNITVSVNVEQLCPLQMLLDIYRNSDYFWIC